MKTRVAALLLLAPLSPAFGAEPLVTDRPDITESADSVDRGQAQLEAGVSFERLDQEETLSAGELLLRLGLSPRWELRIGAGPWTSTLLPDGERIEGLDDAFLGAKVELTSGDGPAAALLFGTSVSTGAEDVGEDGAQPEVILAAEGELTDRLGLAGNAGYRRARADGEEFDQAFASLALGIAATELTGFFVEAFALQREEPGGSEVVGVDAGWTRLVGDDLQFDAFAGTRFTGEDPAWFLGVGVSKRWR